jgi:hypothetical protein
MNARIRKWWFYKNPQERANIYANVFLAVAVVVMLTVLAVTR